MDDTELRVLKRNGEYQDVSFDKILKRVKTLGNKNNNKNENENENENEQNLQVNYSQLVLKVIDQLYNDIPTKTIDELTAQQCASLCTKHPDYETLASRIIISNLHKKTQMIRFLMLCMNYIILEISTIIIASLLSKDVWDVINTYKEEFNSMIDNERDYLFDYFGYKTLEGAYLMKIDKKTIERPQYMWLRVKYWYSLQIRQYLEGC